MEDFKTLLKVAPVGIAVASDPECRTIWVNGALSRILGVAESVNISQSGPDAASLPFRMCRDGRELRPEELPMQLAAATGKEVMGGELQIVRADGRSIDVLFFAAPVFDEDGRVRGAMEVAVDISERRALENRLHRVQRIQSLGVMTAGIAHVFNGHLTSIIGNATSAFDLLPESSDGRRLLAASLESGYHAADLIRQVLADTGNAYRKLRPVNLAEILDERHLSGLSLTDSKAEVRFRIDTRLPSIKADPAEIQQVIRNLVQNAVEAIGSSGVIDISASVSELPEDTADGDIPAGRYVHIQVKDMGPGMPSDVVAKAFDPFFTTKFLGRGLGLSAVLGIMRAHNGAVRLETVPSLGTTVHLFFPVDGTERDPALSGPPQAVFWPSRRRRQPKNWAAWRFSSRCWRRRVPIRGMSGPRDSTHAIASCEGVRPEAERGRYMSLRNGATIDRLRSVMNGANTSAGPDIHLRNSSLRRPR